MTELPEMIRAFIAVRVPDFARTLLAQVQGQLRRELRDVSWTRPEAIHLTLQFLGNIESAPCGDLESALRTATSDIAPFKLALGGLGTFGGRVVWMGVSRGEDELKRLAEAVRRVATPFSSHEENRSFNAHLTLGRLRRPSRAVEVALRKVTAERSTPWTVNEFELIRSELSPQGSRYTTLATIHLRK